MAKGGAFERQLSKDLSLWWTKGKRDDVFWRTATSGGRATARRRRGKRTFGQYGDVQAVDPIGQPLLDIVTIEAKKGYNRATLCDVLDVLPRYSPKQKRMVIHPQPWEKFVTQAVRDSEAARTPYWLLIHKRDSRAAVVFMTWRFYSDLAVIAGSPIWESVPRIKFKLAVDEEGPVGAIVAVTLEEFLLRVSPDHIKQLGAMKKKRRGKIRKIRRRK